MFYITEDYTLHEFEVAPAPHFEVATGNDLHYWYNAHGVYFQREFCAETLAAAQELARKLLTEELAETRAELRNQHRYLKERSQTTLNPHRIRADIKESHNRVRELKEIQRRIQGD
jgi:hypothetical protein